MSTEVTDQELLASLDHFFAEQFGDDVVASTEGRGIRADLWEAVVRLDLPGVGISEDQGGAGGGLPQVVAMLQAAGRHSVPLPLAEHHLASWLLTDAGEIVPDGPFTIVPGTRGDDLKLRGDRLHGVAAQVPWAASAAGIVAIVLDDSGTTKLVVIDPADVEISSGVDLAGQPRSTIRAHGACCRIIASGRRPDELARRGALLRSAQIAGALEALAAKTVHYVREREQFGRAIGSFQSVQLHVVTVQQTATMTALCVARAVSAVEVGDASFEIDAVRVIAGENAGIAARAAHQAHGAIGMTREFPLQHLTRRLNTWRWDFDEPTETAVRIGAAVNRFGSVRDVVTAAPSTKAVQVA
jgi:acyl-CoA dehydrogenase